MKSSSTLIAENREFVDDSSGSAWSEVGEQWHKL